MTRRRPVAPAAPAPPPPPPTAEELLAELRRTAERSLARLTAEAEHLRSVIARARPGEAAGNAWTAARLVSCEAQCEAWREVAELVAESTVIVTTPAGLRISLSRWQAERGPVVDLRWQGEIHADTIAAEACEAVRWLTGRAVRVRVSDGRVALDDGWTAETWRCDWAE